MPAPVIPRVLAILACLLAPLAAPGQSRTGRPVRAVIVGDSIAAFMGGNFGTFLEGACRNVQVRNLAEQKLTPAGIAERLRTRVLGDPAFQPKGAGAESWVVILGGVNGVGNPERTLHHLREMIRGAHRAGMKVAGLSLTPWGSEKESYWKGFAGLRMLEATTRVRDFVLGRLKPLQALGRYAKGQAEWEAGDLPDVAVDLLDSDLRDRGAALRPADVVTAAIERDPVVRARLARLPEGGRAAARQALINRAREVPRWFLRKDLRSFDAAHPNREGHRIIAATVCPRLPASWGCDCRVIADARPRGR